MQTISFDIPEGATKGAIVVSDPTFIIPPPPPDPNSPPTANAGSDVAITLPVNSVTLRGVANDSDGTIKSVLWAQTKGPLCNMTSVDTPNAVVQNMTEGVYEFIFTVTDNEDAKSFDYVTVTVKAAVPVPPDDGYVTVLQTGYDQKSDIVNGHNQLGNGQLSTTVFKTGPGSFKAIVPSGSGAISSGFRSEVQYEDSHTPNNVPMIIEYDTLFESWANSTGLSFQIHGHQDNTSGQMSLWLDGGRLKVQWNPRGTAGSSNNYSNNIFTPTKNIWYHFRWEILFSTGNDGYIRFFSNGQKLYDTGLTKTCDGGGQYPKTGINWFSSPSSAIIVYIDNFIIKHKTS